MQDQREPTPEDQFARRTRLLRDAFGWSQTGLAARLGEHGLKVDGTAITRLERGTRTIRLNEAVAIAHELGFTTVDTMLHGPLRTPEEELAQARADEAEAEQRATWALAEHAAARAKVRQLEQSATEPRREDR